MIINITSKVGKEVGAERIARCAAPNDHPLFIEGLADIVEKHLKEGPRVSPQLLFRCPKCDNLNCSKTKTWIAKVANEWWTELRRKNKNNQHNDKNYKLNNFLLLKATVAFTTL